MFGVSIDNRPDGPVGSPATRRAIAIHWNWTTDYSTEEISTALGVTERTVEKYLASGPNEEVKAQMDRVEAEVRLVAVAELKSQLQDAGSRSRTAEKPMKVYQTDDGSLEVRDVVDDDTGELITKKPVPQDVQLLPDEEARYYARAEVRDILDKLVDITGVAEPEVQKHEHSGEGGGGIIIRTTAKETPDE